MKTGISWKKFKQMIRLKQILIWMPVSLLLISGILILSVTGCNKSADKIKVGVFIVDVTPPIGSPVAYADGPL